MHRRAFTRFLTFGAGSLSLLKAAEADDQQADENPQADTPGVPAGRAATTAVNVADYTALAKKKLPKATFEYISTGSADQITLRENMAAFERMQVFPPLLKGVAKADLSTTVLGEKIALPIMLAQAALPRLEPGGAIVNISGVIAEQNLPGMAAYGASKAATRAFGEAFAREARRLPWPPIQFHALYESLTRRRIRCRRSQ